MKLAAVIHSDPEILGGTPVFVGTRVPAQTLFEYLEGGTPLTSSSTNSQPAGAGSPTGRLL